MKAAFPFIYDVSADVSAFRFGGSRVSQREGF
jgi:hypothetical protein